MGGQKRFKVAFSFPGESRALVKAVADKLSEEFGEEAILYDKYRWAKAELPGMDLDVHLPDLYREDSELIVVFMLEKYDEKEWCLLEWRAIRDFAKSKDVDRLRILPVSDGTPIPGFFSTDGYVDTNEEGVDEIAQIIFDRYQLIQGKKTSDLNGLDAASIKFLPEDIGQECNDESDQDHESEDAFVEEVKSNLAAEIDNPKVSVFKELVHENLKKALSTRSIDDVKSSNGLDIAHSLVELFHLGGYKLPVLWEVLSIATVLCFDQKQGRGVYYKESRDSHREIKEAVEQILGWLMLVSIKHQYAAKLSASANSDEESGLHFILPVRTKFGVETIVSRQRKVKPEFKLAKQENHQNPQLHLPSNAVFLNEDDIPWEPKSAISNLKDKILKHLDKSGDEVSSQMYSDEEIDMFLFNQQQSDEKGFYLAINFKNKQEEPVHESTIFELLGQLKELTLVSIRVKQDEMVFCAPEKGLFDAIARFLDKMNRLLNHENSPA